MQCLHLLIVAAITVVQITRTEGRSTLLAELSQSNATGEELRKLLLRALSFVNSTNITVTVTDINECQSATFNTCSRHAICTNTNGSFTCACPSETFVDENSNSPGTNCSDIDECMRGNHNCSRKATCTNTIGGFNCTCINGFSGDGINCTDVDECQTNLHNCSSFASCSNTEGNYTCSCNKGFVGNGFTCEALSTAETEISTKSSLSTTTSSATDSSTSRKAALFTDTTTSTTDSPQISSTSPILSTSVNMPAETITPISSTSEVSRSVTTSSTEANISDKNNSVPSESTARSTTSPVTSASTLTSHSSTGYTTAETAMSNSSEAGAKSIPTALASTVSGVTAVPSITRLTTKEPSVTTAPTTQQRNLSATTELQTTTASTAKLGTTERPTTSSESKLSTSVANSETPISTEQIISTVNAISQSSTVLSTTISTLTNKTEPDLPLNSTYSMTNWLPTTASPSTTNSATQSSTTASVSMTSSEDQSSTTTSAPTTTFTTRSSTAESASTTNPATPSSTTASTTNSETQSSTASTANSTTQSSIAESASASISATQSSTTVSTAHSTTQSSTAESTSTTNSPTRTSTTALKTNSETQSTTASTTNLTTQSSTPESASANNFSTKSSTTLSTTNSTTQSFTTSSKTSLATQSSTTASDSTTDHATESSTAGSASTSHSATQPSTIPSLVSTTNSATQSSITASDVGTITASTQVTISLPVYNGNVEQYINELDNTSEMLGTGTSRKLNVYEASTTISNFNDIITNNPTAVSSSVATTAMRIVNGFVDAAISGGEVVMDAEVSNNMTKLVTAVLEVMSLDNGEFSQNASNLATLARDSIFNNSVSERFQSGTTTIELPRQFVEEPSPGRIARDLSQVNATSYRLAFTRYADSRLFIGKNASFVRDGQTPNASDFANITSIINSPVVGASVRGKEIKNSSSRVRITLNTLANKPVVTTFDNGTSETITFTGNPKCVFWNYSLSDWSEKGCTLVSSFNASVTCECNHLTSFAVIMSVEKTAEDPVLTYLSYVGAGLSIAGLIFTIITYSTFRSLRKHRSKKVLLHFCFALCGLYLTYILGIAAKLPASPGQCIASGFFMHFFTLSVMAWMSVEVFDMYMMFVKVIRRTINKYMLKAGLIAWCLPLIAALITLGAHLGMPDREIYPKFTAGTTVCWLGRAGMLYAFVIPSCIILLINLVLFSIVLYNVTCKRTRSVVNRIGRRSGRNIKATNHVANALALLLLAGPTWIIGYLINIEPIADGLARRSLSYIFVILNAFQGFWIFIVFCIRPAPVRRKWVLLLTKGRLEELTTSSTISSSNRRTTRTVTKSPRLNSSPVSCREIEKSSPQNQLKTPVFHSSSNSSSNSDSSQAKSSTGDSKSRLIFHNVKDKDSTGYTSGRSTPSIDAKVIANTPRPDSQSSFDANDIVHPSDNEKNRV